MCNGGGLRKRSAGLGQEAATPTAEGRVAPAAPQPRKEEEEDACSDGTMDSLEDWPGLVEDDSTDVLANLHLPELPLLDPKVAKAAAEAALGQGSQFGEEIAAYERQLHWFLTGTRKEGGPSTAAPASSQLASGISADAVSSAPRAGMGATAGGGEEAGEGKDAEPSAQGQPAAPQISSPPMEYQVVLFDQRMRRRNLCGYGTQGAPGA